MDAVNEFRARALAPQDPEEVHGTTQKPRYLLPKSKALTVSTPTLLSAPRKNEANLELTGREYKLFNYYGDENAEDVIIAMGSVTETIEEVVDYLNAKGEKAGVLKVHLYRPWSIKTMDSMLRR